MAGNDGAASLQACALRLARLNTDGTTPAGATNAITVKDLVSVDAKPNLQSGQDIVVVNACGAIFAAYKSPDMLKRYDVTLTLPTADVEVEEMLTGAALLTANGVSSGVSSPAVNGLPPTGVCLEAWTKAWIGGGPPPATVFADGVTATDTSLHSNTAHFTARDVGVPVTGTGIPTNTVISTVTNSTTVVLSQATTATATGVTITLGRLGQYWRYVFPWLGGCSPAEKKLDNSPLSVAYTGPTYENPNIGNGPFNDWPTGLLATSGRSYSRFRDTALPDLSTIGYIATPAQV